MNQATSIFGGIYRRMHVVLLVTAGSVAVGLYENSVNPPDYVAVAEIMIPDDTLGISIDTEDGNVPGGPLLPVQAEDELIGIVAILRSRSVVNRVHDLIPGTNPTNLRKNIRADVSKEGLVEYTCYGQTPEEAVQIANTSVEAFAYVLEDMALDGMRANLTSFQKREPEAWEEVKQRSEEVTTYLTSLQSADLNTEVQNWLEERANIQTSLFDLETRNQSFLAQRPVVERALEGRPEYVLSRQEMQLPGGYTGALESVADLSSQLAVARLQFRDAHPEILRLQTELDLARSNASTQADLILTSSVMSQDAQVAALAQQLVDMDISEAGYTPQREFYLARQAELDILLQGVPGYQQQLSRLQNEHAQARSMAERISSRREELEFHIDHGLAFSIIDPYALASVPLAKRIPTVFGVILFTAFSGLLLGVFVALIAATIARMRETRPY